MNTKFYFFPPQTNLNLMNKLNKFDLKYLAVKTKNYIRLNYDHFLIFILCSESQDILKILQTCYFGTLGMLYQAQQIQ